MNDEAEERPRKNSRSIRGIPFFSDLAPEECETIERLFVKRHYYKDQIVLLEEQNCSCMYLIYSGKVRVVRQNEEGKEQIIAIHKKNDFFGEMSLLDGKTSPATVVAHEDSVLGFLAKEDFDKHLLNHPAVRQKIIDLLCARLRDSWAVIRILSYDGAENRVVAVLDRLQQQCGIRDDRGVIINVKLTHQQVADCASLTRETVSRVLKLMQKDGLVSILDNKAILLKHPFLERSRLSTSVAFRSSLPRISAAIKECEGEVAISGAVPPPVQLYQPI